MNVLFQYRTWCNGMWSAWTNCETDTYNYMKDISESDSSVDVRMVSVPKNPPVGESFVNWWESLAHPFDEGQPRIAANQAWDHSRYVAEKETLEIVANAIYDQWKFMPGWEPWVAGGNSMRQEDARKLAQKYTGK